MSIRVDASRKVDPTGKPLIPGINELTTAAVAGHTPEQEKAVGVARAMIGDSATIETILSQIRLTRSIFCQRSIAARFRLRYVEVSPSGGGVIGSSKIVAA